MECSEIVEKLIRIKKRNKWTNYKIAKESGLPASTVASIFNQKTTPQMDTFIALCKGFGVSLSEFFGTEEKFNNLTESEIEIVSLWEELDDEQRACIKSAIKLMNRKFDKD